MLTDKDPTKSQRATMEMLKMKKLEIDRLKRAQEGKYDIQ